ncbi:tol-pal system-associated acyl-CoA thioesterase [Rhizobium sp. EC-SD404]|uniref:tol-pal system-associated acyl-CoA thioesterase n=1 Tax=Rhizobium sp. EC-SD404 TaxID=2038389 RepID=UPI00125FC621|nr:tol-pal system-associated acyl-CoA thioesterase [Rhizobium sp. EC-SD404]
MPMVLAGELTRDGHRLLQRVYYEDTDFSGVVYHARYLHFMERGRTDYLRLLGIAQRAMSETERLAFVVRHMDIDFKQPARMDDVLTIDTATVEARGARLTLSQTINRGSTVLIEAKVDVAVIDGQGRPRRLPADVAKAFAPR